MIGYFIIDSGSLDLEGYRRYLPRERCDGIDSFRFMSDKLNSYATGLFMKALADRFDKDVEYGPNGKPYLHGNPVFFNISHSGHYTVCAVSDSEIGIDIERIGSNDDVAETVMTSSELSVYRDLPDVVRGRTFAELWTAKESIMKYMGTGLTLSPKELTVLGKGGIIKSQNGMFLIQVSCPEGYCTAICSGELMDPVPPTVLSPEKLLKGDLPF